MNDFKKKLNHYLNNFKIRIDKKISDKLVIRKS